MPVGPIGIFTVANDEKKEVVNTLQEQFYGITTDTDTGNSGDVASSLTLNKTFQQNRHTVADVFSYLENIYGRRFWYTPTYDRQTVTLMGYAGSGRQSYEAHNVGSGVRPTIEVVENGALNEIRPINTVKVNGSAAETLFEVSDHEVNIATDKYVGAEARHRELYEAAGQTKVYARPDYSSSANTKREVQNEAKSILKRAIGNQSSGGDITALFAPDIQPYDTIYAKQNCNSENVFPFEVNEVHHKVRTDGRSKTEMQVSYPAHFDDIEIVDTWQKTVN